MNPSRAIGGGRMRMPRRCATAGISPAIPAIFDQGRRSVRHRPRRRHDHHRRRERLARSKSKAACRCIRPSPRWPWSACRRALGQDRRRIRQARARRSTAASSTSSAAPRGWPISSGRAAIVFVDEIPKSPVGKLLRRKLVAGEYRPKAQPPDATRSNRRKSA